MGKNQENWETQGNPRKRRKNGKNPNKTGKNGGKKEEK